MTSRLGTLVPAPLRPFARRVYRLLRGRVAAGGTTDPSRPNRAAAPAQLAAEPAAEPMAGKTAEELRDYWRRPPDGNVPASYRDRPERSAYLVEILRRHAAPEARLLEIGCNVGRNLHHLHEAGYRTLTGIEISEDAIAALRAAFPDSAARADLHVGAAEDVLPTMAEGSFDLVFTMAVLEHIHPSSEWLFDDIRRICAGHLITIEDERSRSWRHYPRDYGALFTARGFEELWTEQVPAETGLPSGFRARVFRITSPRAAG